MSTKAERIIKGWGNFVFRSKSVEQLARVRAKICGDCESIEEMTLDITTGDEIEEAAGMKCGKCKCPLSAKVRVVDESCPKDLW